MSVPSRLLAAIDELELPPEEIIFGVTEEMQAVRRQVETAASADMPVLVAGERGTGKEVIAKLIHARSPSSAGAFVKVDCAAIPETLLESELFGCERGALTGASWAKPGLVETAGRGTLFLDQIAGLPPTQRARLLQPLLDGRLGRAGEHTERRTEA